MFKYIYVKIIKVALKQWFSKLVYINLYIMFYKNANVWATKNDSNLIGLGLELRSSTFSFTWMDHHN